MHASIVSASDCIATVPDRSVVFFQIDQAEFDKLDESKKTGTEAVLYDFQCYTSQARQRLESKGLHVILTSCDTIRVAAKEGTKEFKRKSLGERCGVMFVKNGEEPKIVPEVMTDGELVDEADKFFGVGR